MNVTLWLAASYLLGGIPTSYLAGRIARGIDLRRHGSGNLGATNAFRVLGWRLAVPVLILDIAKGWLPVWLFARLDAAAPEWALAYGAAAVFGHVFSVFVGFRGGKGVATSGGVLLALAPVAVLTAVVAWLGVVAATRIVSLASLVAALVMPPVVFLTRGPGPILWLATALAVFVILAHRSNIRRLVRGEEHRFGRSGAGEVG